jgi:hypothetical protein
MLFISKVESSWRRRHLSVAFLDLYRVLLVVYETSETKSYDQEVKKSSERKVVVEEVVKLEQDLLPQTDPGFK